MGGRTNRWEHPDVRSEDQNVELPPPAKRASAMRPIVLLLFAEFPQLCGSPAFTFVLCDLVLL